MKETSHKKDLSSFIYCSSRLEEMVAKAYANIASIINDDLLRGLLTYISRDSQKHAEFFKAMCNWLNHSIELDPKKCAELWGEKWKSVMDEAETLQKKSNINPEELSSLIEGLEKLEGMVAEEYLTAMHIRLIELIAKDKKVDLNHCKQILEWIIEDENRHERILKTIKSMLTK
ncbi:MAG: ferritin family protein [Candidatus Methanomethylicaceae archaeon]